VPFRIKRSRLAAVGLLFCVLAALFAVEAKLAWYGPDPGPSTQISASKLQPAEAPRIIAETLSFSANVLPIPFISLIVVVLAVNILFARCAEADAGRQVPVGFSPQVFFRPPPSL